MCTCQNTQHITYCFEFLDAYERDDDSVCGCDCLCQDNPACMCGSCLNIDYSNCVEPELVEEEEEDEEEEGEEEEEEEEGKIEEETDEADGPDSVS